jgi:uncharacterized membrane protein YeaQ/YmgE (transglycosylase-associated protein family)
MEAILSAIGLTLKTFIIGAIGGLLSLRFFDGLSWWGRFATVLGGGVIASYGTALALEFLELSAKHEGFLALMIGVFGMSVVAAVIKAVASADLWKEIVERLPGGKGK